MKKQEIINKVISKLAKKIKDDSNTFIRKINNDDGFIWEVGLSTEQIYEIKKEEEAMKMLDSLKNKEKKL